MLGSSNLPERFWRKVLNHPATGCWEWLAAKNNSGYGTFNSGERTVTCHRYAYENLVAPVPRELNVDHLCRNKACVNPGHLEPVTPKENTRRGLVMQNGQRNKTKTHCPKGHPYDEVNTYRYRGKRYCKSC